MHTLLYLQSNIATFHAHLGRPAWTTFMPSIMLMTEAGAIYVVERGYVDFARLYMLPHAGAIFDDVVTQVEHTKLIA